MRNNTKNVTCSLCCDIFLHPVTTSCGHSFCRGCISTNYAYSKSCPLCRSPILSDPQNLHTSSVLEAYIKNTHPIKYAERIQEHEEQLRCCESKLPFLLINSYAPFPNEEIVIQICEPRYILLVQRVMKHTSKEFCIVPFSQTNEGFVIHKVGSKVELLNCEPLENGYEIHIRGVACVEIQDKVLAEGYWHGSVKEYRNNIPSSTQALYNIKQNIHGIVERFKQLQKLYSNNPSVPETTQALLQNGLPKATTAEEWSLLCFHLGSVLPLTIKWRLEIMKCNSLYDRTQILLHILNREWC